MTDFGPAGHDARGQLVRETLAELNSIQTTTDADRLASGVLRESLEIGVIQFDAGEHLRNIRTVRSDVDLARMIFDNMPTANADDWSVTAERMSKVPQAFAGMCESWRLGMQRGIVPHEWSPTLSSTAAWPSPPTDHGMRENNGHRNWHLSFWLRDRLLMMPSTDPILTKTLDDPHRQSHTN